MNLKNTIALAFISMMVAGTVITGIAFGQVTVDLTPTYLPPLIPASGCPINYRITITNTSGSSQNFDVWCMVTMPDSSSYGPVVGPVNLTVPAGFSNYRDRSQDVPANAPGGVYEFYAYAGVYPDEVWSSDSFQFEKSADAPDTLWTQTFGGANGHDYGWCGQQTQDGGYIIVGNTWSLGANECDVYLIKTDYLGNEEWFQTYGEYSYNYGYCVQQTQDGGYIIAGDTRYENIEPDDVFVVKTDSLGNEEWNLTWGGGGGPDENTARYVQQTQDGGYIVTGWTEIIGAGWCDLLLLKIDATGNEEWVQAYGGIYTDIGQCVQQTPDGGYIITGGAESYNINAVMDVYLIKTDSLGFIEWYRVLGGPYWDIGRSVQQTGDGGYIVTGATEPTNWTSYAQDAYLIRTDSMGNEEWSQNFGWIGWDDGYSVTQTQDGGYIVAGWTVGSYGLGDDAFLVKTDSSGTVEWMEMYGGTGSECAHSIQQIQDGSYIITGYTLSYGPGGYDVWLIRLAPETAVNRLFGIPPEAEILGTPSEFALAQNYPNPFNATTTISFQLPVASRTDLKIYDISGRFITEIINGWRDAGQHEVTFDGSNLASGIYVYELRAGDFISSGKMVLIK